MRSSNLNTINADNKMYFLQFNETDAQKKESNQTKQKELEGSSNVYSI